MDQIGEGHREAEIGRRTEKARHQRREGERALDHQSGGGEALIAGIDIAEMDLSLIGACRPAEQGGILVEKRDPRATLGQSEGKATALQAAAEDGDT